MDENLNVKETRKDDVGDVKDDHRGERTLTSCLRDRRANSVRHYRSRFVETIALVPDI